MSQIDQAFIKAYRQQRTAGAPQQAPQPVARSQALSSGAQVRVDAPHTTPAQAAQSHALQTPSAFRPAARVPTPHLQLTTETAARLASDLRGRAADGNNMAQSPASRNWSSSLRTASRFRSLHQEHAASIQPPAEVIEERAASHASVEETLMRLVGIGGEEEIVREPQVVQTQITVPQVEKPQAEDVPVEAPQVAKPPAELPKVAAPHTSEPVVEAPVVEEQAEANAEAAAEIAQPTAKQPEPAKQAPAAPVPIAEQHPVVAPATEQTTDQPVESAISQVAEQEEVAEETSAEPAAEAPAPVEAEAPKTLQAAWEVDAFHWPAIVEQLQTDPIAGIDAACAALREGVAGGSKLLAISGVAEGAGATTLSLLLARGLAKAGLNVALVDANFEQPELAENLGVRIQDGWEAVIDGRLPLEEVCVSSLNDGVTLIPAMQKSDAGATKSSLEAAGVLKRLAEVFDIVLIDAGSGSENVAAVATGSDEVLDVAVLLAVDERHADAPRTSEIITHLKQFSIHSIQIAQTYVAV